ncbi:DUF6427 family protein [Bergeyella sp. RCAD1439]|uniref:DUF6427 family protein n=1 Tax=Bergeyella anatis TaxID=3113737 RepID=UPI002E170170|nr:DUF6427 family protein [Bergeyella sp. RCAD1439]
MFKLLSKESNIFSIPVYILFLLLVITAFNVLNFSLLESISAGVAFLGISLVYFVFNPMNLTYQTHVPLFLYTFFIFGFYPENMDLGLSVSLLTNSFLLLVLSSTEDQVRKRSYLLVGAFLAVNYLFLPTTWPMLIFVVMHIIATSRQIALNLFRLVFGIVLVFFAYFCLMYTIGFTTFNADYLPIDLGPVRRDFSSLYSLVPVVVLLVYAVLDHFNHFNEKSPDSRFKYTFLLIFVMAQLTTIVLYMGEHHQYLMLMAFPASVILSRMLRFLPNYWMKELGLWLIIGCMLAFKVLNYFQLF